MEPRRELRRGVLLESSVERGIRETFSLCGKRLLFLLVTRRKMQQESYMTLMLVPESHDLEAVF